MLRHWLQWNGKNIDVIQYEMTVLMNRFYFLTYKCIVKTSIDSRRSEYCSFYNTEKHPKILTEMLDRKRDR